MTTLSFLALLQAALDKLAHDLSADGQDYWQDNPSSRTLYDRATAEIARRVKAEKGKQK